MSQTTLNSYDPNWETRWEEANARVQSLQWMFSDGSVDTTARDRTYAAALQALHAAFEAQFKTVEAYRDYFLRFDMILADGADVPPPQFPAGADLAQVKAILGKFRDDSWKAKIRHHAPPPYDPLGLSAFTTPCRSGFRRQVQDLEIDVGQRSPLRCRLAMETSPNEVHACVIAGEYGPSTTNYIEHAADAIYRSLPQPVGLVQKTRSILGLSTSRVYRPNQIHFYDYHPAPATPGISDDFSSVKMRWSASNGFTAPEWKQYPTTPLWIADVAETMPRHAPDFAGRGIDCAAAL